jgi:hypothetical protein
MQVASPSGKRNPYVRNNPFRYMSIDTDALAAEAALLDCEAFGALMKVRLQLWRRNAPLPDDDKAIASAIGEDIRRVRRLRPAIAPCVIVSDGTVRDQHVEKAQAFACRSARTQIKDPPEVRRDLFAKPLKSAAPFSCKESKNIEPGGSMSSAREARPAPAAPPTQPRPPCSKPSGKEKGRSRADARKTALDPAWELSPADRTHAQQRGYDDIAIERQARRFAHHHRAHGSRFFNWHEAWCYWLDRAEEFAERDRRRGETREERNERITRTRRQHIVEVMARRQAARTTDVDAQRWSQVT